MSKAKQAPAAAVPTQDDALIAYHRWVQDRIGDVINSAHFLRLNLLSLSIKGVLDVVSEEQRQMIYNDLIGSASFFEAPPAGGQQ